MAYRETAQVKARKAAQREALLRTAETLVREGGFAAMTMQTVADRAGVGVGTLYRYFDNKATLAAAVFAVATQREVDAVDRALAGGGDASARLERALRLFARRALAAPRLACALIAEPVEPEVDALPQLPHGISAMLSAINTHVQGTSSIFDDELRRLDRLAAQRAEGTMHC